MAVNHQRMFPVPIFPGSEIPRTVPLNGKYNSYRMVSFSPLTLNQNVAVAAFSEPSRMLSGDFYDVFPMDMNRFGVIIADACGKGPEAARLIMQVRELLKIELEAKSSIEETMKNVNDNVESILINGKFITLFFGIYDSTANIFTYANAGHDLPVIIHENQSHEWLKSTGPGLGIIPGANFDTDICYLQPNDVMILYTDGVTDVFNDYSEIYGEQRMVECLSRFMWYPPHSMIEAVMKDIGHFAQSERVPDDRTMIVLKVL